MSEIISFYANPGLTGIEDALAQLFTDESDTRNSSTMGHLARLVQQHGCEGHLTSSSAVAGKGVPITLYALDVAWFVPDTDWKVSKGRQVCWSKHSTPGQERWYEEVLSRYFGDDGAASLLTLPDVYTVKQFVNLSWLENQPQKVKEQPRAESSSHWIFAQPFTPRRSNSAVTGGWEDHFQRYRELISTQLRSACPELRQDRTLLAWFYVGPDTLPEDDSPPHWGASIFVVFQLSAPELANRDVPPEVYMLLANLLRVLRSAAPAALGSRREKQSLAQVLAHEFKNVAVESANLAHEVRARALSLARLSSHPTWRESIRQEDLVLMGKKAETLNYSVQSCGAFALAAYWLFSPKTAEIVPIPDPGARHFRHALALTLRIVGATMSNWHYEGVPDEKEILAHFRAVGLKADGIEKLPGHFAISVMVFFALEAARNMKKYLGHGAPVRIAIGGIDKEVELRATTEGELPTQTERSASLAALREEVGMHCPWRLIEVNPIVRAELELAAGEPSRVTRITTFTVFKIPPLHAPHDLRS